MPSSHVHSQHLTHSCTIHWQCCQHLLTPKKSSLKPPALATGTWLLSLHHSFQLQLQPKGSQDTGTAKQQHCALGNGFGTVTGKNFQVWLGFFFPPTKTFIPELMNMVFNCCSPTTSYSDTDFLVQSKTSQFTMAATLQGTGYRAKA